MQNIIGQSIGRYHITEQLGQGGMATVFKAYDTRLERDVALKFIRREAISPEMAEQMLKRFEREARALAKFMHAGIVPVLDYGEHEGSPYLVMGYLPGGTLKARTGSPVPYTEAAGMLVPIAQALAYAHQRGVVHRDVKPANILITEDGAPMLSDFGIAKALGSNQETQLTGTGVGIGTPDYMAPEQWMGKVDHRTDIYALGIIFYELVTGGRPFTADTPAAVLIKHVNDPLPRPAALVPGLPESVERVMFTALAKKPEDRYPDMGIFAAALEKLSAEAPTQQVAKPAKTQDDVETLVDTPMSINLDDILGDGTPDVLPEAKPRKGGRGLKIIGIIAAALAVLAAGYFALRGLLPGAQSPQATLTPIIAVLEVEVTSTPEAQPAEQEAADTPLAAFDAYVAQQLDSGASLIFEDDFDDSFVADWNMWESTPYLNDGVLQIDGNDFWPGISRKANYRTGTTVLALVSGSAGSIFEVYMGTDEFGWHAWGAQIEPGTYVRSNEQHETAGFVGGESFLGTLKPEADHWYIVQLSILASDHFQALVWDWQDPENSSEMIWALEEGFDELRWDDAVRWMMYNWRPTITSGGGTVEIEKYVEIQQ